MFTQNYKIHWTCTDNLDIFIKQMSNEVVLIKFDVWENKVVLM